MLADRGETALAAKVRWSEPLRRSCNHQAAVKPGGAGKRGCFGSTMAAIVVFASTLTTGAIGSNRGIAKPALFPGVELGRASG
jgi:hypothetical protein